MLLFGDVDQVVNSLSLSQRDNMPNPSEINLVLNELD